jgi:unsaturated chondroitin disaccharide hydrolase
VIIEAAESLARRYNPMIGAIQSWDFGAWRFPVIIDNMMNLELLFRASELQDTSRFYDLAATHASTTLAQHFRADGSSYHLVDFDPATGAALRRQTNQGLHDESAWARGQAWGLYGFTMAFRETRDARFLEQACKIADFIIGHPAMPADGVPWFDFDVPEVAGVPALRDASAGAIATSALLELRGFAAPASAARYEGFALQTLRALCSPSYRATRGDNHHFLLMHSVGNYPLRDELDVALNYADYYFLEALLRAAR